MGCCFSEPVDFDSEVNLYHFRLHRVIGKGAFAKVQVVEHKQSKELYVLKSIDKARCIRAKAVANLIEERRLLEEIDHIFIVKLCYAFQDDNHCFLVLDAMLGGDLRFHLGRYRHIPENDVRFWVAEVSSALNYLHCHKIMHRDIKPENILLDSMGHAHITDFNVAVHYSDHRLHTSVSGTMAYMAPQVISPKKGYSWQVDWWSLGVTAYELLFHKHPFDGRNAEEITQSILNGNLTFPEPSPRSSAAISALKGFINHDPHTRLCYHGSSQGPEGIQHPWFASFDWDALERKACRPPFVPSTSEANFNVRAHQLDEFFLDEKPLKHSKRKVNPNFEKMTPELRQMEEQFMAFDFSRAAIRHRAVDSSIGTSAIRTSSPPHRSDRIPSPLHSDLPNNLPHNTPTK